MTIIQLDGKKIEWKPKGEIVNLDTKPKSLLHKKARKLLLNYFNVVLEEVCIPVYESHRLYLDFYIPMYNIAVEVQGRQHFEFIPRFHKDLLGFGRHKRRDEEKAQWCLLNNIKLITLNYKDKKWKQIIATITTGL